MRHASKDFNETIKYALAAQPYKVNCLGHLEVISVHNGMVSNYEEIRKNLSQEHHFESEAVRLIDSEIVAHVFEENLVISNDEIEARKKTFETIEEANTVVLLTIERGKSLLHIIHKGMTRGLHIWTNDIGNIILCSREEPARQVFPRLFA